MSPYDLLGLDRDASEAQVRRAYRRLARRWHPDLNPGNADAARRYAAITEAFDTLVDPVRRRAFDASGVVVPRRTRDTAGLCRLRFFARGARRPGVDVRRPVRRRLPPGGRRRNQAPRVVPTSTPRSRCHSRTCCTGRRGGSTCSGGSRAACAAALASSTRRRWPAASAAVPASSGSVAGTWCSCDRATPATVLAWLASVRATGAMGTVSTTPRSPW